MKICSKWIGNIRYQNSLDRQDHFLKLAQKYSNLYILGVEHDLVITLGLRGKKSDILANKSQLANTSVFRVKRGGQATIHSHGQVVIYPIVPVRNLKIKIKNFLDLLIEVTEKTLNFFETQTYFDYKKKGFYTKNGKIAFLGLQFTRGVSKHGISINVSNDLSLNSLIRPCGVSDERFDKLSNYETTDLKRVFDSWTREFCLGIKKL